MDKPERHVCYECIDDLGLREFIESEAVNKRCDFCGKSSRKLIAAPLSEIVSYMKRCIEEHYCDANEWYSYDGGEIADTFETWDTQELLEDLLEFPEKNGESLLDAIVEEMDEDHQWCKRDPYGVDEQDEVDFSWSYFSEVIRKERRFFFQTVPAEHPDLLSPMEMLRNITLYSESVGLFKELKRGTKLFRARKPRRGEILSKATDFGPPPAEKAFKSGRMNPPGVVVFYVSDSPETAIREIAHSPGNYLTGQFTTKRTAVILDLANLPPEPSIFEGISDSLEYDPRKLIIFLRHVASEISKPIIPDDRAHVEYVPTQVVSEYIKSYSRPNGSRIDGIRFRSSVHKEHTSYVFFASQDNLLPAPPKKWIWEREQDRWLKFQGKPDYKSVKASDIKKWSGHKKRAKK